MVWPRQCHSQRMPYAMENRKNDTVPTAAARSGLISRTTPANCVIRYDAPASTMASSPQAKARTAGVAS